MGLRVESITFNGKTYPVTSEMSYAQVERVRGESKVRKRCDQGRGDRGRARPDTRSPNKVDGDWRGAARPSGAAIGAANAKVDGCVPSGGRITVRLTQPLVVQVT